MDRLVLSQGISEHETLVNTTLSKRHATLCHQWLAINRFKKGRQKKDNWINYSCGINDSV